MQCQELPELVPFNSYHRNNLTRIGSSCPSAATQVCLHTTLFKTPRRNGQGNEGHEGDEEEGSDEGHEGHEEVKAMRAIKDMKPLRP